MRCDVSRERLQRYLEGSLSAAEAAQVHAHVQACDACQSIQLVTPDFGALLRQRLLGDAPSPAFVSGLRQTLASGAPESSGAPWWQGWLASPWMPRLAMVLVLALLFLVPVRGLFRAPALAQEALRSHNLHAPTCDGPLPSCCTDLALDVGQWLPEPSRGRRVPDLRPLGLELIVTSLCAGRVEVARLCYRDAGGALFSLYITDRVAEEFQALHLRAVRGLLQDHYRVEGSEVTLWEQGGLVHFWIGPRGNSHYNVALAFLQRQE